jgi:ATP-binding cassette, subfamily B, bacterial PglK
VTHKLLVVLDKGQLRRLMFVLAGTLVGSMIEMIGVGSIPVYVGLLVEPNRIFSALPDGPTTNWIRRLDQSNLVLYGAALLAGLFLLKNMYLTILTYAEIHLIQNILASASNRLFKLYLDNPYTFHLRRNPAELVRNLTDEIAHAMDFLKGGVRLVREGLVLMVIFILMVLVDPIVSLSILGLLGLASGVFYLGVKGALTRRGQLCQDHLSRQMQIVNQSLGAIKEAKLLGREPYLVRLFGREVRGLCYNETFYGVIVCSPKYFLEVLAIAAILPISAAFVMLDRPIQDMLPVLTLFGVAAMRFVPAVSSINMALVDIRYKRPAFDLVCAELENSVGSVAPRPSLTGAENQSAKLREAIRLDNVHYRYQGASTDALQGVSLTIRAGEAVAFIGTSGTGKSTLINVILGLLAPTTGEVYVDGVNIRQNLSAWQRQIGYIPQDVYLMDDSIRRNIAFGLPDEDINDLAMAKALQAAQLDQLIRDLPEGVETIVGDRGIRLSGGQRQRIGIARALYHDPTVLVMDEATSALDHDTECDVMQAVRALQRDKTLIVIAHRRSTVEHCGRVFQLDQGRVIPLRERAAAQGTKPKVQRHYL